MKNPLVIVLIILLAAILLLIGIVSMIAKKNVAAMNRCVDTALEELKKHYVKVINEYGLKE